MYLHCAAVLLLCTTHNTEKQGAEFFLQKPNECFDDSVLLTRFKLDEARAADERAKEHNDKVGSRAAEYALTSGGVPEPRQAVHFVASLISTATGNGYYAPRSALYTH
jgi:hypothetical protein